MALIPLAAVFAVLVLLLGLGLKGQFVFNPPYLLLALTLVFYWLVTPVVSYISAKGYLATGSFALLFVCLAFFVGVPFSIATGITAVSSANQTVTLGALGLLVSSAFQLLGAAQASFGSVGVGSEKRKLRLTLALIGILALSAIVILLGVMNVFPPFFVQGSGITFIDEAVYGLVILFFAVGGLLYARLYLKSKVNTLYVYSLALMLYAVGSFGITQQVAFGDLIVWIGRLSTYIGLIYFLFALLRSRQGNS